MFTFCRENKFLIGQSTKHFSVKTGFEDLKKCKQNFGGLDTTNELVLSRDMSYFWKEKIHQPGSLSFQSSIQCPIQYWIWYDFFPAAPKLDCLLTHQIWSKFHSPHYRLHTLQRLENLLPLKNKDLNHEVLISKID